MATTIKLKNGSGAPLAGDLVQGEPAFDLTNKRLYTEDSGGSVIEVGTNPTSLTTGTFTSTGIDDNATSTAITIDASENVGIGTASPNAYANYTTLTLNGATSSALDFEGGGTLMAEVFAASNDLSLQTTNSDGQLIFKSAAGSEAMRISSNGNVGIGTTGPSTILDVREESTGGSTQIRVYNTDNSNTTTQTASLFLSPDSRGNGALVFAEKENADFSTSASRDVALVFSPVLNNSQTEAMRIDSSGQVIISGNSGNTTNSLDLDYNGSSGEAKIQADSSGGSTFLTFGTSASGTVAERMRINSSGNVSIGTALATFRFNVSSASSTTTNLESTSGSSVLRLTNSGGLASVGSIGNELYFTTSTTERMRINSSGNVGIGTDTPQSPLQLNKTPPTAFGSPFLSIGHDTYTGSGMYTIAFGYEAAGGSNAPAEIGMVTTSDSSFTKGDLVFATRDAVTDTAPTERVRIDSNGDVQIHGISMLSSSILSVDGSGEARNGVAAKVNNNAYYTYVGINASGTNTFLVYGDGDVENTNNSYGAISDERLKSNIVDASSQIDDIMAVQVRSYTLNETGDTHIGVVAQELEASGMSGLVKTDEEGMKSVKYSILYMKAIKALQEAVTRIETLEAEVAALKGE